jgi:hypothetical protein
MPNELKDQFMERLNSINEKKRQLLTKGKEYQNSGDAENANKAKGYLRGLREQEALLQQQYLNEAVAQKQAVLDGMASGETIKDYVKTVKQYTPDFDPSGMGSYGSSDNSFDEKVYKQNPEKLKKELSKLGYEDVDVETGVSTLDTAILAGLRNDDSRKEYFQRAGKGYDLLETLNIDGRQNFLVKNKEGKNILALPKGINMKDVGAFVASETIPTISGIAAAPSGLAGGPIAPATVAAAGAAGYAVGGSIQDAALRAVLFMDVKPKEIAIDRSKEAALGFLTGYGAGKIIQPLARRSGSTIENIVAKDLMEAESLLKKSPKYNKLNELDNVTPVGAEMAGEAGIALQRGLAGKFPSMAVATKMQGVRNTLGEIQDVILKEGKDLPPVDFTRVKTKAEKLAGHIARKDESIRKANEKIISQRVDYLRPVSTNKVELGNTISKLVDDAAAKGDEINKATFDAFYASPNVASVSVPKAEVLGQIQRKLSDPINRGLRSPEVESLLKEYQKSFPDNLTMRDIDNIRKGISGATSKTNSSTTSQQVASGVAAEVGNIFENTLAKYNLTADWANTMKVFDETSLAFRRSSPGAILAEKFGAKTKSPEVMVETALSSTQAAKDLIGALKVTGDDAGADMLREQLKNVYKEQIGIAPDGVFNGINSKHTPEMVETLWENPIIAKRINSQISELNDVLKKVKVDKVNMDANEANRLLELIPLNERKELLKQIEKKAIIQKQQEKFFDNEVIKLAKNGQFDNIDGDVLAHTALYKATPQELDDIMSMLTPSGKKKLGADMFSKLGKDFAGGAEEELFSGGQAGLKTLSWKKINKELLGYDRKDGRNAPQWLKSMDKVVGRDTMDEFIAVAKVGEANSPLTKIEAETMGLHSLWSPQGAKWYVSNPFGYLNNLTLATAYGSNNLRPMLRYMSKNIGDVKYAENMNKMMRGITMTRPGVQALIEQAKDDPQFTRDVGLMYAEMAKELEQEKQAQQQR